MRFVCFHPGLSNFTVVTDTRGRMGMIDGANCRWSNMVVSDRSYDTRSNLKRDFFSRRDEGKFAKIS